ncbi:hypothetical protein IQ07DRAFT_341579 [Pyrenochaeta sp. DS3sAY3a]|nr:hypothetical protein IQ07DRAFT_341579 [Pyrenochaeta sp. DS3sAY3a]
MYRADAMEPILVGIQVFIFLRHQGRSGSRLIAFTLTCRGECTENGPSIRSTWTKLPTLSTSTSQSTRGRCAVAQSGILCDKAYWALDSKTLSLHQPLHQPWFRSRLHQMGNGRCSNSQNAAIPLCLPIRQRLPLAIFQPLFYPMPLISSHHGLHLSNHSS